MKKILIAVLVLLVIIGIGATVLVNNLDGLVKDAIEKEGTAALGSAVAVQKVETKLREGKILINGLSIANPAGYKDKYALLINSFSADVDYENQIVEEIAIDNPTINAELKGSIVDYKNIRNNFEDLVNNMPEDNAVEEESSGDDVVLTIKALYLRQAKVNITAEELGEQSFVMDNFTMRNLKGNSDQLSERITNELTAHITAQVKTFAAAQAATILKATATKAIKEEASKRVDELVDKNLKGLPIGDEIKKKLKFKF